MKAFFTSKKNIFLILLAFFLLVGSVGAGWGYQKYQISKLQKQADSINTIVSQEELSKSDCKILLEEDSEKFLKKGIVFEKELFEQKSGNCRKMYDISQAELTLEFCTSLMQGTKKDFISSYLVLDAFGEVQKNCSLKFLTATFATGSLFDPENDFKTSISLTFGIPFYQDLDVESENEAFLAHRIEAKKRLLDLLEIEPKIDISIDDVVLYPEKAILELPLEPQKTYTFSLKKYEAPGLKGEQVKTEKFTISLPENHYFGIRTPEKVSFFQDSKQPNFELLSYDTPKTGAKLKICRISNESYAKVELFKEQKNMGEARKKFFKQEIDSLPSYDCKEKQVNFDPSENLLKKKTFNFEDILGTPARSGLYYVTFADAAERENYGKIQEALFFGIIDSHITMKVSRNGEAFFFVNDFEGNPLAGQNIRVYVNDFAPVKKDYNQAKNDYDVTYNSPLEKNIFGKEIVLGKTDENGILKVDLKKHIDDAFYKTFASWNYDWDGSYNGFFVTAASDTNLSYVSSQWNGGIAGWNFGYTLGDGWWYGTSQNIDEIRLDNWVNEEPKMYSHSFTDRKLYLPGETVYLKSVVRNSADLSIPTGQELTLSITDSAGKEVLSKKVTLSEYGSFSETLELQKDAALGTYYINISAGDIQVGQTAFSVEVFKNPKFENEVMLETEGLNGELLQNVQTEVKKIENTWGDYEETLYKADFIIKASVKSKYYSGSPVKKAAFDYKVYKQYYYDNTYWDDCYYGCYWEPEKEFYTEGSGSLDENGLAQFAVPVAFQSSYDDFKYIVEVTVRDSAGDSIAGSNAIVARLPESLKMWNPASGISFETEKRFYKQGEKIKITGGLTQGKFTKEYEDDFLLIIKKKDYITNYVNDVRGYKRPMTRTQETLEQVLSVNSKNFSLDTDGRLSLSYSLKDTGEYVIEFGKKLPNEAIDASPSIDPNTKKYFTLLSYGDTVAKNPVQSDNKITILSEKVSYKPGETARVLVRLPYTGARILWTVEKQGVLKQEYITVPGNTFFKEVLVDDSFVPNAYIGVMAVDTRNETIPEYKVGYTEIVVDKTEKKSDIEISLNKKVYEPREKVDIALQVRDIRGKGKTSEVTLMVVDESLISLMGNIDTNLLEKFFKKLPFQIQTSITNIAMLKNYYVSRQGIVGGSGFGNFKGGDSAVSTRTIFKNTAYYNASVITDNSGKAKVSFTLPDNLTNFRVMAIAASKDNFFGYSENTLEVRKEVLVEEKTPLILREGDEITLGANIFNMTDKEIGFTSTLSFPDAEIIGDKQKISQIGAGQSEFVTWQVKNTKHCEFLSANCALTYTISVLGDSVKHSDKIEGKIDIKHIPTLIQSNYTSRILSSGETADMTLSIAENTDIEKSLYELTISNTPLAGIKDIVKSLAVYPYGCGEQLLSSTLPNAILLQFKNLLGDIGVSDAEIQKNLDYGLEKIYAMQLPNGSMKYWEGDSEGNTTITAYALRVLLAIQESGKKVDSEVIKKTLSYLETQYPLTQGSEKLEILWALSSYHGTNTAKVLKIADISKEFQKESLNRHELLVYSYALLQSGVPLSAADMTEIETKLKNDENVYWYDDRLADTALFTQLLLAQKQDEKRTAELIASLANRDWQSYWFTTKAKNTAFQAFARYIEIYGTSKANTVEFTLNGKKTTLEVGSSGKQSSSSSEKLAKLAQDGKVSLQVKNISGGSLFVDAAIRSYPKDALKVPSYARDIQLTRKIYEVINEKSVVPVCNWDTGNYLCTPASGLKDHSGDTFKKGTKYKIVLEAKFPDEQGRQNLTLEDYLPAGFRILNKNFFTSGIATSQATTQDYWTWSHVEQRPEVVMANTQYSWGNTASYEYFVTADFAGTFLYPPAVAYLMYEPETRANTEFRRVVIK